MVVRRSAWPEQYGGVWDAGVVTHMQDADKLSQVVNATNTPSTHKHTHAHTHTRTRTHTSRVCNVWGCLLNLAIQRESGLWQDSDCRPFPRTEGKSQFRAHYTRGLTHTPYHQNTHHPLSTRSLALIGVLWCQHMSRPESVALTADRLQTLRESLQASTNANETDQDTDQELHNQTHIDPLVWEHAVAELERCVHIRMVVFVWCVTGSDRHASAFTGK